MSKPPVKKSPAKSPSATKKAAKAPTKPVAKASAKKPLAKSPAAKATKAVPKKASHVTPKPTPTAKKAAPAFKKPAPVTKKAAPAAKKPAPAAKKATPAAKNTPPVKLKSKLPTGKSTPAAKTVVPAKTVAPAKATPAPVAAKPARRKSAARSKIKAPPVVISHDAALAEAGAATRFADRFAPPKPSARAVFDPMHIVTRPAFKPDPKLVNVWKAKAGRDLTDAELLAMPDSEYMGDKQIELFRARLAELKADLLSNADETTEHLREDTTVVPDPVDRATIEEEHALELRTRDRERKLLKKIAQSMVRLDNGEYGFCDETGEPIGLGRLLARPTATLSLEAQQRRELKQKMFGD